MLSVSPCPHSPWFSPTFRRRELSRLPIDLERRGGELRDGRPNHSCCRPEEKPKFKMTETTNAIKM